MVLGCLFAVPHKEGDGRTAMHAGDGDGMQDAQPAGEGRGRQFPRQRREVTHGQHLVEGIETPLDDLVGGPLDELPPDFPEEEHRITGVDIGIRAIAKSDKTDDRAVQAGFLLQFAHNGGIGRFIALHKPARQGPVTTVWLLIALNEEDCGGIAFHNDSPDPERIVPKVDKTAPPLLRGTVRSFAPLKGV